MSTQPRLLDVSLAGVYPMSLDEANEKLERWQHKLGRVWRPTGIQAFGFEVAGRIVSVAVSASIVSPTVHTYKRTEVVELARVCSDPANSWATRVMVRLWREVCAPLWPYWSLRAAVSYSQNAYHKGDIYRFDGWEKVKENAGSTGGGTWSAKRVAGDPIFGKKTLWVWRYE